VRRARDTYSTVIRFVDNFDSKATEPLDQTFDLVSTMAGKIVPAFAAGSIELKI
jgi:hypothetical protein